jgi:hypothetical protein
MLNHAGQPTAVFGGEICDWSEVAHRNAVGVPAPIYRRIAASTEPQPHGFRIEPPLSVQFKGRAAPIVARRSGPLAASPWPASWALNRRQLRNKHIIGPEE